MTTTESGAAFAPVTAKHHARIGEDRYLWFRLVDAAGAAFADFTGWTFEWAMREQREDPDVIMSKVSPTDIVGAMHDDWKAPGNSILMARVFIARGSWPAGMAAGTYFHSLVRTDAGHWSALAEGPFEALHAAVR